MNIKQKDIEAGKYVVLTADDFKRITQAQAALLKGARSMTSLIRAQDRLKSDVTLDRPYAQLLVGIDLLDLAMGTELEVVV